MVAKQTILIIEDEFAIRAMLRYGLEMAGFDVIEAEDVNQAKSLIKQHHPELFLLDWMLPQQCGISFAKELKEDKCTKDIPIIMLTAKDEEDNKILGLEAGADDYITKPFSPRELVARVRAVLRRGSCAVRTGIIQIDGLQIDTHNQRVMINQQPIKLGPLEYRLLWFFSKHPNRVFSRSELLAHVWGENAYVDERTIDVHIRRLRKQLSVGDYDTLIQTVHGSGYRFNTEEHEHQL